VHRPPADPPNSSDRALAAAERALADAGLAARPTPSSEGAARLELTAPPGEVPAYCKALAGCGFAPVPARGGAGPGSLMAFDRETGDWLELTLRSPEGAPLAPVPAPGRLRGVGAAVMGPDGAGKSTLIESLERELPLPVEGIYMGLYQGTENTAPKRSPVPGMALAANIARQQRRWLRGLRLRRAGSIVLFDRYTYDSLLPTGRPISRLGKLRRGLLGHAAPGPDLLIVLDAPAEVLFERKGEHDLELLDLHRRGLLALAERLPGGVVVDASQDAETVARDAIDAIWSRYRAQAA
jgi:thymidylate kinase